MGGGVQPSSTATLYVDLGRGVTVVGATWKNKLFLKLYCWWCVLRGMLSSMFQQLWMFWKQQLSWLGSSCSSSSGDLVLFSVLKFHPFSFPDHFSVWVHHSVGTGSTGVADGCCMIEYSQSSVLLRWVEGVHLLGSLSFYAVLPC